MTFGKSVMTGVLIGLCLMILLGCSTVPAIKDSPSLQPREISPTDIKTYRDLAEEYLRLKSEFQKCEADKKAANDRNAGKYAANRFFR